MSAHARSGSSPGRLLVALWDGLALICFAGWAGILSVSIARPDFVPPKEMSLAAVALLATLAGMLRVWRDVSIADGIVWRVCAGAFDRWRRVIADTPRASLAIAAIGVALLWTFSSLRRHWALGSYSFDLGIYTNGLWNLTHGFGYVSSLKGGMHLFADHQTPTYWLIAPVFQLWPTAEILLVLQAAAYVSTGGALYILARQYGGRGWWGAAALPLLFWNYLPIRNANAFDARPDSFMVPLLLWSLAGLQSERPPARIGGAIAMLLALGCKETAAIVAVSIGIAWTLGAGPAATRRFTRLTGIAVGVIAAAVLVVDVTLVPRAVRGTYQYANLYAQYGPRTIDLLAAPVTHTRQFFGQILQPDVFSYVFWTLAPLGFLPALDWCAWIVSGPASLGLFLANTPYRITIEYQYSNEICIGLLWGWARMAPRLTRIPPRSLQIWVAAWALAASAGSDLLRIRHYTPTFHADWIREELVPALDPRAALAVSDAIVPHVATRHWVGNLSQLAAADGRPSPCVVIDAGLQDRWLTPADLDTLTRDLPGRGYRVEFTCGSVTMFSRDDAACLQRPLRCPM